MVLAGSLSSKPCEKICMYLNFSEQKDSFQTFLKSTLKKSYIELKVPQEFFLR